MKTRAAKAVKVLILLLSLAGVLSAQEYRTRRDELTQEWRELLQQCQTYHLTKEAEELRWASTGGEIYEIPFEVHHNLVVVKVTIGGKGPFNFIFDSGAAMNVINPELAEQLGLQTTVGMKEMVNGTMGIMPSLTTLPTIQIEDLKADNMPAAVLSVPQVKQLNSLKEDLGGILGCHFLMRFRTTWDYKEKKFLAQEFKSFSTNTTIAFNQDAGETLTREYTERKAKIAQKHYQLAMWCRGKGMETQAKSNLIQALKFSPSHAESLKQLGYEPVGLIRDKEETGVVPFKLTMGLPLITAKINNKSFSFVLDMGASLTVFTPTTAKAINISGGEKINGLFGRDATINEIAALQLGTLTTTNIKLAICEIPQLDALEMAGVEVGGVIGYNVIARYRITWDHRAKKVLFVPNRDFEPPIGIPFAASGSLSLPKAFLGIEVVPSYDPPGLIIQRVLPDSPADKSGLKEKDVIIEFNNKNLCQQKELTEELGKYTPGTEITLTIMRGGVKQEMTVVLGERR